MAGRSGVKISDKKKIERDNKNFSPEFLNLVFGKKKGEFTDVFVEGDEIILARVDDILFPKAPDEVELLETKTKAQDEISDEIMTQYLSYLATKYSISMDSISKAQNNE